jgi:hypothetical protein
MSAYLGSLAEVQALQARNTVCRLFKKRMKGVWFEISVET